ncbi:DUF1146 family protein [Rubeoparvulum massiliense]|uniref:DUF1146 family protein n=1 Tax=Rubeoparvulum massiliense TaxID=1631346 RepID=UPI00065DDADB|nr:DUF1146 family protein [Rubeoparvulum massiliense]
MDVANHLTGIGIQGLFSILLTLFFIAISWWLLQGFRVDLFLAEPSSKKSKLLILFLAIIIGHGVGRFFIDYYIWTSQLRFFFS